MSSITQVIQISNPMTPEAMATLPPRRTNSCSGLISFKGSWSTHPIMALG